MKPQLIFSLPVFLYLPPSPLSLSLSLSLLDSSLPAHYGDTPPAGGDYSFSSSNPYPSPPSTARSTLCE